MNTINLALIAYGCGVVAFYIACVLNFRATTERNLDVVVSVATIVALIWPLVVPVLLLFNVTEYILKRKPKP